MLLTAEKLKEEGTPKYRVAEFETKYPDGCEVTSESIRNLIELVGWQQLQDILSPEGRASYKKIADAAAATYGEVCQMALLTALNEDSIEETK